MSERVFRQLLAWLPKIFPVPAERDLVAAVCMEKIEEARRVAVPELSAPEPGWVTVQRPGAEPVRLRFAHECVHLAIDVLATPQGIGIASNEADALRHALKRLAGALERRGLPECLEAAAQIHRITVSAVEERAYLR